MGARSRPGHLGTGPCPEPVTRLLAAAVCTAGIVAAAVAAAAPATTAFGEAFAIDPMTLALARLVLADPPVAILDEATAEAGSAGARVLEAAAAAAVDGRTALVVAQRLAQAATADRIVVMDAGRVVEDGTHDELVGRGGGEYAVLWGRGRRSGRGSNFVRFGRGAAPARAGAMRWGALTARQRAWADCTSLKTTASAAARLPAPLSPTLASFAVLARASLAPDACTGMEDHRGHTGGSR